ncbi:MAG: type II toxin-antitoxin system PemK/MazF family toxin [Rhodothermales bacterium]
MKITRYGVYWANLDPVVGSEISKTRPVVIVSDNAMNATLKTVVACPLTSSLHPVWRSRVQVVVKGKKSEVAVDQIRTLAKERLYRRLGSIDPDDALKIRILISEMYGNG